MDLLTGNVYAAGWEKVGAARGFSENDLAKIDHIEVVNTKDGNKQVLDKLSLAIYVGKKGERMYKAVDKNSNLKVGDQVDPKSVIAQDYTDGNQTCTRFDGKAL